MAKCERPCWTIAFFLIWCLVVPGVLLTHVSVGLLIPPISDLPANIATGFDSVFRFAFMEADAKNIKDTSSTVLTQCTVTEPVTACADPNAYPVQTLPSQQVTVDTATEKASIIKAFGNSLEVVKKVANDKYFGTPEMNNTAKQLDKMTAEMAKIDDTMKCYIAVPVFCGLWQSGDGIVAGMAEVNTAIDAFKTSDMVKRWDDHKGILMVLHGLPYILVIGMVFFSFFWLRGGVCCCCRGGTKTGFCLIFYALFWLVAFIIYAVVGAVGLGIKYMADRIEVPVLKGKPTLDLAIEHIQVNYPEFWNVVFADLASGLDMLLNSASFFVAAALLIMLYSLVLCCCCPYRKKAEAKGGEGETA